MNEAEGRRSTEGASFHSPGWSAGFVKAQNDVALKGRYSDDPHHLLAIANS
jgi:hypothetical protein